MSTVKANNYYDASGGSAAKLYGVSMRDGGTGWVNRIINGAQGIWQRGTSFSVTAGQYAQDRWLLYAPSGSFSSTRSTDVPSGFQFSAELTGTNPSLTQRIEAVNCFDLVGGSVTVSFWAKSTSGTQGLFVTLQNPSASDNWISITDFAATTVSASPSSNWTYYTATFNNLPAGVANGLGLAIGRSAGGSTTTRITGVQLEAGTVATPFERRDYGRELMMCQRYYALLNPGRNIHLTSYNLGARFVTDPAWPVDMRAAPSVSGTFSGGVNPGFSQISTTGCHVFSDGGGCFVTAETFRVSAEL